jgi:hypothetical protein
MCWSCWIGDLSAWPAGTADERGGMMTVVGCSGCLRAIA